MLILFLHCFIEPSNNPLLQDNDIILLHLNVGEFKIQLKPSAQPDLKLELT